MFKARLAPTPRVTFLNARSLEVTLLTGLRTGEVIGARWTEIDLKRKTWVIPPERLKDRKTRTEPHRVPLSPQVTSTRFVNDEVKSFTVGVVARLPDCLDLSGRQPSRCPGHFRPKIHPKE